MDNKQIPSKHSQPDVKKAKKQMLVFNQTLTCFSAFALLFNILFKIELLPFFLLLSHLLQLYMPFSVRNVPQRLHLRRYFFILRHLMKA